MEEKINPVIDTAEVIDNSKDFDLVAKIIDDDDTFKKSNYMMTAKYKTSAQEESILNISLSKLKIYPAEIGAQIQATIFPNELKGIFSDEKHIYRDLRRMADSLLNKRIVIEDGKGNFHAFVFITNAAYENQRLNIIFNHVMLPYVTGLTSNFTLLSKAVLTSFKHVSSTRLYQVLRKELYHCDPEVNNGKYDVTYNVSELRFMLGLANPENEKVRTALRKSGPSKNIDWDHLYNMLPGEERKYERYRDFASRVLEPARKEITEKSDLTFTYVPIRLGRSIRKVRFTISPNKPAKDYSQRMKKMENLQEKYSKEDLEKSVAKAQLYNDLVGHNKISRDDVTVFLKYAEGDVKRVRDAVALADKQPEIYNYNGWVIGCIRGDYKEVATINGSAERAEYWAEYDRKIVKMKATGEYWESMWSRIKTKEDFPDFERYLFTNNSSIDALETFYSTEDRVKRYSDWKAEELGSR